MTRYSVQPRDRIFVEGYGFLSFSENMGKNIGKNISKTLSNKYSQKPLDHTNQSATVALKTVSKRATQKKAELQNFSRTSPQNSSETVIFEGEIDRKIPKERYLFPEKRQKVIDNLRLIRLYNNGIWTNNRDIKNSPNRKFKFRSRNWVEINDE